MQAPKCRICATNHWSQEPCKFPDAKTAPATIEDVEPKEVKIAIKTSTPPIADDDMITITRAEYDRLVGRRTYQREYMQKRRAKKSPNQGA